MDLNTSSKRGIREYGSEMEIFEDKRHFVPVDFNSNKCRLDCDL